MFGVETRTLPFILVVCEVKFSYLLFCLYLTLLNVRKCPKYATKMFINGKKIWVNIKK